MSTAHSKRAGRALRALGEDDPALAALSLWCKHRDAVSGKTRTSGDTIYYGPEFAALARDEQIGVAAHHVLHVAFRHAARGAAMRRRLGSGYDETLFNIAADAIVNETLLAAGYVLPRPRVALDTVLPNRAGESGGSLSQWDVERLYSTLTLGSGSGGSDDARSVVDRAQKAGFVPDLDGKDGEQAEEDPNLDWQGRVRRALQAGREAGRGLGRISGSLGDLPETFTPWERLLRSAVTTALARTPAPKPLRPSRRFLGMDAASRSVGEKSPAFEAAWARLAERPRIAVLFDASGSVPRGVRARFGGEIQGIAARTGAELRVIVFDSEVRLETSIEPHAAHRAISAWDLPEGGGTDFGPALSAARAARPSVIVVLTDLEAEIGPPEGRVPVIWATPDHPRKLPPYGRLVTLGR